MTEEDESRVQRIDRLMYRLVEIVEAEVSTNAQGVDTRELGEAVDMIKDLAEAERSCREAGYYRAVTEAMESYDGGRMGYNPNRDSMGRYTTPGRARTRRGYEAPDGDSGDVGGRHMPQRPVRAGYRPGDPDAHMDTWGDDIDGERHGRAFDMYRRDKRHYTKTHSEADRQGMRDHASEHMSETMATIREIWDDADPELRKRMKADLTKLTSEMNA